MPGSCFSSRFLSAEVRPSSFFATNLAYLEGLEGGEAASGSLAAGVVAASGDTGAAPFSCWDGPASAAPPSAAAA